MCGSVGRMWREAHSGEGGGLWVPGLMHICIVTIEPMVGAERSAMLGVSQSYPRSSGVELALPPFPRPFLRSPRRALIWLR